MKYRMYNAETRKEYIIYDKDIKIAGPMAQVKEIPMEVHEKIALREVMRSGGNMSIGKTTVTAIA